MRGKNRRKHTFLSVIFLFFFVVSTTVTGCGEEEPTEESATPHAGQQAAAEHERALKVEDGAMTAESTVIAVGQTPVTYSEYRTYYYFMNRQYTSLLGDEVWKQRVDSDKTIGQEAIEDVLRMIIQVKVIAKEAERQGVTLEADEKEDADYSAQQFFDGLDEEITRENMMTGQEMMKIFEENRLAKKMYHVVTGQADAGASQSGQNAYRVQLLYKKAGEDRESVRSEMDNLRKKIINSDKSFYVYAKEETELPEVEEVIGSADERQTLYTVITTLQNGSISDIIEESDGFYIAVVLEKPNDTLDTEYQNEIVTRRQIEAFQKTYETWSKSYDVDVSDSLLSEK